ncbi:macrophage colony-stimulating factor 1 isoform X1 [Talpa occidentalis]|uniref:macrophage colony-stimulating factor 1 isoform X1 n=1 Tax=Talpa occidentalis TaxID=50954 RepID=UPI0018900C5C|nr:macrophage colony-stimulating factor 1 isoform X1 [Talpa occidentalis]XP_037355247.1 macrophage colony-stimulating factor 1 isoform X1 [Talpa occidentalis]
MNARGAAGRCPPTTWLGPWLLLLCLLVSGSITMEVPSQYCSEMITDRHLKMLQDLIDSQMETSCQIAFEFVDQEQLKDPVCYLKKAFFLVEDIIEDTLRFKHKTPNADTIEQLRELSVSLNEKHCFTKDYDEHDKACIRTFSETPLQLLEKIKSIFNETRNFLKKDWKIFSKNCNDSFAKCASQDVVTKPDCNCLYPKAIPSSDLASVSPQQPLTRSKVPMAGLTWSDSEGTEGSSLLPGEQPQAVPSSNHPGSAKQRPPRSTCQSFETLETPGVEGSPTEDSAQPHPSAGARLPGVDDVLDSVLGTDWALEEASGEASEELVPQGAELSSSSLGGSSIQAEMASPSDLLPASSPLPQLAKGQQPADETVTSLPKMGPGTPTGQAQNHTPEKTDRSSALPRDHQDSARTPSLRPQGLSSPSTLSAQPQLPRSHSWGNMLPIGELEGKRSTRERRSPAELEGGQASDRAARPPARFNPVPLTDAGHDRQRVEASDLQPSGFVFPLSSIILVLLAVGGLLLYRRKRRSHREPHTVDSPMEQPEGSPLTPDEDRQMELPV